MSDTDFSDPVAYRGRIIAGVVNAVLDAGRQDGSEGAVVELSTAIDGLCDAIALIVAGAITETPKQRRETAERCRRRILSSSTEVARRVAGGEDLPFAFEAMGAKN